MAINFIDFVPLEVTNIIANNIDAKSFPSFLATCKFARDNTTSILKDKVIGKTEEIIQGIIKSIKMYDTLLFKPEVKYETCKIICHEFFRELLNCANRGERDFLNELLTEITIQIAEEVDGTATDVQLVLEKIISNELIEDEFEIQIVEAVQDYLFKREYDVIFDLIGENAKYRFVMKVNLVEEQPQLQIICEDEKNEVFSHDNPFSEEISTHIPDVEMTPDGEMQFSATPENIKGLALYFQKVFGNGLFFRELTEDGVIIELCNILNQPWRCCEFYHKTIQGLHITQVVSQNIAKMLLNI